MDEELLSVQDESVQAEKEESHRFDKDYSEEKRYSYNSVKNAVIDARYVLSTQELAKAIVSGLFDWAGNQVELIIKLMEALGEETGEPVKVTNLADGK